MRYVETKKSLPKTWHFAKNFAEPEIFPLVAPTHVFPAIERVIYISIYEGVIYLVLGHFCLAQTQCKKDNSQKQNHPGRHPIS